MRDAFLAFGGGSRGTLHYTSHPGHINPYFDSRVSFLMTNPPVNSLPRAASRPYGAAAGDGTLLHDLSECPGLDARGLRRRGDEPQDVLPVNAEQAQVPDRSMLEACNQAAQPFCSR